MAALTWRHFRRHRLALAGSAVLLVIILACVFAPLITPYDPVASNLGDQLQGPSASHWFGTNQVGQDLFTRVLYGGRISLSIGALAVLLAISIGIVVGSIAGYYGGWIDNILMRIADAMLAIPQLLILIILAQVLRERKLFGFSSGSVAPIILVIGILAWMGVARLVRAAFLSLKEKEFIEAARASGASNGRIMLRHLLPNALSPVIVAASLRVAGAIITESGLSYLGFGVQPPTATWGNMLKDGQYQMTYAPWVAVFPGLMIFITVIAINYI
ncbi:MAG: ABC transporter permease, partial [Anaerolineae bacterium]|nr:ABC transporter permease [Anaerolineae bacterium]